MQNWTDAMQQLRPRAERTRTDILAAAESVFAEHGFAGARLEEVAHRAGIKRASIAYYFRDKRELYDAVLGGVFGGLLARYQSVLNTPTPLADQVPAIIDAWISYAAERRSVAPIMLREAAPASPAERAVLAQHSRPVVEAVVQVVASGQRQRVFGSIDPIHFVFAVVGATVFFLSGTPTLVPDWPHDPFSCEQVNALRDEVLGIARRLLGVPEGNGGSRLVRRLRPGTVSNGNGARAGVAKRNAKRSRPL